MNWKKRSKEKINEKFLQKFKIPSCQNTGAVFALIDDSRTIKKKLLHLRYIVIPLTKLTSQKKIITLQKEITVGNVFLMI